MCRNLKKRSKIFMINRVLLRIKIIQIYIHSTKAMEIQFCSRKSCFTVLKELTTCIFTCCSCLSKLPSMPPPLTHRESKRNKLRPSEEDLNPNTRFIDNSFIRQLTTNTQFVEGFNDKTSRGSIIPTLSSNYMKS